jgi:hypothetical protein
MPKIHAEEERTGSPLSSHSIIRLGRECATSATQHWQTREQESERRPLIAVPKARGL